MSLSQSFLATGPFGCFLLTVLYLPVCSGPALDSEHLGEPFILLPPSAIMSFGSLGEILYSLKLDLKVSMVLYGKF